ncbi:Killer toxin subunits alpha/beta [Tolypocladium ophioglossoides CBS 100239]|uniref:Killer toxin subunits alpha/beta n=1 Tax=Tolypocladium ophioglossoides (strain CBS 100239) TaxID=1163406 RepID=A0A0L0N8R8_TOLOC|nr:Killer toxin subunits alpha/beta [Tolypocladium ophioglossoides CBS 100239]
MRLVQLPSLALLAAGVGWPSPAAAVLETPSGDYADLCPGRCSTLGTDPGNWSHLRSVSELERCPEPLLFDVNVQSPVGDPGAHVTIRACSQAPGGENDKLGGRPRAASSGASATGLTASAADVSAAAGQLAGYLRDGELCGSLILFAKSGEAVVGLYSGADMHERSTAGFLQRFQDRAKTGATMMQVCGVQNATDMDRKLGVFAGSLAHLGAVQGAVKSWADGKCLDDAGFAHADDLRVTVFVSAVAARSPTNSAARRRALCKDTQVVSGDSCGSLASRCKISGADLVKFNPKRNLCGTLMPRQYVCCSAGILPDHTPQQSMDKKCYPYTVKARDSCYSIADAYGIKTKAIEDHNNQTWGWAGCGHLQPRPSGPQKPGTQEPDDAKLDISTLNPCPLNVCCNVWGFCGTSSDFCVKSPADTGAPGTSRPGTSSCVSNCGNDIKNNGKPPAKFIQVGYFEAWNFQRECLTMDPANIDTATRTHIHFAFAGLIKDFNTSTKKVVSFGGWATSTEPATFQLFRDATDAANRGKFSDNVVGFVINNGLDGLDFDWEYPGATDIPGIPPGTAQNAENYLEFLRLVRKKLLSAATLSIALPASY